MGKIFRRRKFLAQNQLCRVANLIKRRRRAAAAWDSPRRRFIARAGLLGGWLGLKLISGNAFEVALVQHNHEPKFDTREGNMAPSDILLAARHLCVRGV